MIKKDIVKRIKEETSLSDERSKEAVDLIINYVKEALLRKETVEIRGFGAFIVKRKKKGKGWHFMKRKQVDVPDNFRVKFIPSRRLKKEV